MTSVTINYNSGTIPQPPRTKDASTDFSATGTSLNRITDTGSSNSPSLELAYKELPTDRNTVALYHMNEASGNLTDSSGNGNTGTDGSTSVVTGKLNNARSFNGSTSYVSMASQLTGNATKTIEMWIYITSAPGALSYIYSEGSLAGAGYGMRIAMNTTRTINYYEGAGAGGSSLTSNYAVPTSTWTHVAVTYDSISTQSMIYINGVLDSSTTGGTHGTYTASQNSNFGRYVVVPDEYWAGYIDEARFSNIARTPEEIKYDAGRRPYGVYTSDVQNLGTKVSSIDNIRWTENGVQTGDGEVPYSTNALVAQWNFNETSGTTAVSGGSCGSTCNGTVTSMTTTSQDVAAGDGWTANNKRWGTGALMFDGTDGHATVAYDSAFDFNQSGTDGIGDLTYEAWIKTNSKTRSRILGKSDSGNQYGAKFGIGANSDGRMEFVTSSTTSSTTNGKAVVSDGNWHHVVAVRSTNGTSQKIYVDGVLDASETVTAQDISNGSVSLAIGKEANTSTMYFNGVIDTVRAYSRALSATEIISNYQAGNVELQTRTGATTTPNDGTWEDWKPSGNSTEVQLDNLQTLSPVQKINTANLVGYWKLDEVSGNRADSAGSNTLTDNATVTSKAGHLNLAGQFTSANSEYLSITDNTALSTGDIDFEIAGWFYFDDVATDRALVSKASFVGGTDEYYLNFDGGTSQARVTYYAAGGNTQVIASTFGALKASTWYFINTWHDSVNNVIGIAVNGVSTTAAHTYGVRDAAHPFPDFATTIP